MGFSEVVISRLVPATTLDDAEAMRIVRNECRHFMTNDTHEIGVEEQKLWFVSLEHSTTRPFLFVIEPPTHQDVDQIRIDIGYGLIRQIDRRWWVSGGLLPEWRGRGLGKRLFGALTDLVRAEKRPCWLEVRASNSTAFSVYRSLGFEMIERLPEGLVETLVMRRSFP